MSKFDPIAELFRTLQDHLAATATHLRQAHIIAKDVLDDASSAQLRDHLGRVQRIRADIAETLKSGRPFRTGQSSLLFTTPVCPGPRDAVASEDHPHGAD